MVNRTDLINKFITGYKITQQDYQDWLNSIYFKNESPSAEKIQFLDNNTEIIGNKDIFWNSEQETISLKNNFGVINLNSDRFLIVRNDSDEIIEKGTVVTLDSFDGRVFYVIKDPNNISLDNKLGIAIHDINPSEFGMILLEGILNNIDTSLHMFKSYLFLDQTTQKISNVNNGFCLGICLFSHPVSGKIYFKPQKTNYLEFNPNQTIENNSLIKFNSTFGRWESFPVSAFEDLQPTTVSNFSGPSAPNITPILGTGNIKAQEWPHNSSSEEYNPCWQFPHRWKEGTSVRPHLHLVVPNDPVGGIINFQMIYTWENAMSPIENENTITGSLTIGPNEGNKNIILPFPWIDGTDKKISSLLTAKISRLSGTFNRSVWVKSIDIHILTDGFGSLQEYIK